MRRLPILFAVILALAPSGVNAEMVRGGQVDSELLALCYHDVVHTEEEVKLDQTAVTVDMLIQHLSWLAGQGYTPISLERWRSGDPLPPKPVMLTFDDGYKSFRSIVLPLLELYGFPAVLAAVTSWVDTPAGQDVDYGGEARPREGFLNWQDLDEINASGLVEIVSHSHDLHRGILANEFRNVQPAANTLAYDPDRRTYEDDVAYQARLQKDLTLSKSLLEDRFGRSGEVIVWPYGAYHQAANQAAADAGLTDFFTLDDRPNLRGELGVHRELISNKTDLFELKQLATSKQKPLPVRAVHIDLDYVYDRNPRQFSRNLDVLLDRIKAMRVSTVYLQAFADPDGDGVADSLYFPNRHLPVRQDIFNRVAWQLKTRANVQVYAWMPVLAFELPNEEENQRLAVQSVDGSHLERYHRLSPFHPETQKLVSEIYADLGRSVAFDGVLYHDDVFLTDHEDVNPAAQAYAKSLGTSALSPQQKTSYLIGFTDQLTAVLRSWQPELKTARNLYAEIVLNPKSEDWFAQNFEAFLEHYDYTALMAMPYLEQASDPERWLAKLITVVEQSDPGFRRTVFHMQSHDWRTDKPIDSAILGVQFDQLLRSGVRHIAYYPDDFFNNHPDLEMVRERLSINDFPALLEAYGEER